MELKDVVLKLIGPIMPIGETNEDEDRLENLRQFIKLVDALVEEMNDIAGNAERAEYSMSRAGKMAEKFLVDLKESIL